MAATSWIGRQSLPLTRAFRCNDACRFCNIDHVADIQHKLLPSWQPTRIDYCTRHFVCLVVPSSTPALHHPACNGRQHVRQIAIAPRSSTTKGILQHDPDRGRSQRCCSGLLLPFSLVEHCTQSHAERLGMVQHDHRGVSASLDRLIGSRLARRSLVAAGRARHLC